MVHLFTLFMQADSACCLNPVLYLAGHPGIFLIRFSKFQFFFAIVAGPHIPGEALVHNACVYYLSFAEYRFK